MLQWLLVPVAAASMRAVLEALGRAGVDVARLGVRQLDDDQALATLWARAIARTGRPSLPLEIGLSMPLGALGPIDYLAASSATVGAALGVAQQAFPLVAPGVQLQLERRRGGGRRVAVVDQPPFPGQADSDLLVVGILLRRVRELGSRPLDLPLLELSRPAPAPGQLGWWLGLLGLPEVRFGARRAALHLSAADWAVPLRGADPRLLATLRAAVGVEPRSGDALLVAVRALALERLPGRLTLDELGPALGLSGRTLQRRLAASRTSLAAVLDELRRDRAEQLLGEGSLGLGEIAARVGFAEPASFTRAWRRWRGEPPSRSRRRAVTSRGRR